MMRSLELLTLLLTVVSTSCTSYIPGTPGGDWSTEELLAVKAKLRLTYGFYNKKLLSSLALTSLGLPDESDNQTLYYWGSFYSASKVLRLSFHDCLKYSDGSGGCDGCLNWKGVGMYYQDSPGEQLYEDVRFTDNNGLRPSVEVLEAVYTVPDFPAKAPVLPQSLRDSGKSRADLWALAAIVAVEFGVETNNMKCEDLDSVRGCHHLQGEPDCLVTLDTSIPFRSGRADCVPTDSDRPYISDKTEVHPDIMGDGRETVQFFQDNFNFTGQEVVAIMGAHTFGRLSVHNSL